MHVCMLSHFSCLQLFETPWAIHSLPGSSVHGILQARILKWIAMPSPGDLPDPGIKPMSPMSPALAGGFFTTPNTWEAPDWHSTAPQAINYPLERNNISWYNDAFWCFSWMCICLKMQISFNSHCWNLRCQRRERGCFCQDICPGALIFPKQCCMMNSILKGSKSLHLPQIGMWARTQRVFSSKPVTMSWWEFGLKYFFAPGSFVTIQR